MLCILNRLKFIYKSVDVSKELCDKKPIKRMVLYNASPNGAKTLLYSNLVKKLKNLHIVMDN